MAPSATFWRGRWYDDHVDVASPQGIDHLRPLPQQKIARAVDPVTFDPMSRRTEDRDTRTKAAEFEQDLHLRHDPEWRCPQDQGSHRRLAISTANGFALVFIPHL
jgi:hypothetical protein